MKKTVFKISVSVLLLSMVLAMGPGLALASKTVADDKVKDLKVKTQNFDKQGRKLFVEDQIVVKYKNDNKPFRVINLPAGASVEEAVAKYKKNKEVEYAEPNYIAYADMIPNDEYYSPLQWHLDNDAVGSGVNAEEAWDISTGQGVVVAVIDTGLKLGGDDTPICLEEGHDFINNDDDPSDDNGHGTHVSGTIAQNTNNVAGVAGLSFNSCIMSLKALDNEGVGLYTGISDAIFYAVDNGADVINMSLGGSSDGGILADAIQYAYDNDVVVVAAAGNEATSVAHYPSSYLTVISVGATGYDKSLASYSNFGTDVDVVAPGGDMFEYVYNRRGKIVGTTEKDLNGDGYADGVLQETFDELGNFGYFFYQGTSMASPHVAGAAALLLSKDSSLTPDQVREILQNTAEDLGDEYLFGHGLIDAYAALSSLGDLPENHVPSADNQSVITDEDTFVNIVLTATDLDGDTLTYSVVTSPSNGTLSGVAPNLSYIPNGNYNGNDSFTFKVNDGRTNSAVAEVSILVNPIDDATIANDQSVETSQDVAVEIVLTVIDPDSDVLTYALTYPSIGTLSGVAPNFIYTPGVGYIGEDSFSFQVSDGINDSNVATVNISIKAAVEPSMSYSVDVITTEVKLKGWFEYATALVIVVDAGGVPVGSGVTVSGYWSGATSGIASAVTDGNGQVSIVSDMVRKTDIDFIFTVDENL